jgi:hypothetical protein
LITISWRMTASSSTTSTRGGRSGTPSPYRPATRSVVVSLVTFPGR